MPTHLTNEDATLNNATPLYILDASGTPFEAILIGSNDVAEIFSGAFTYDLDGDALMFSASKNTFGTSPITSASSVTDDGDLGPGQFQAYIDEANNKLKFRVCYNDGTTFKTGEVALT